MRGSGRIAIGVGLGGCLRLGGGEELTLSMVPTSPLQPAK